MTAEQPTPDPSALVRELREYADAEVGYDTGDGRLVNAAADMIERLQADWIEAQNHFAIQEGRIREARARIAELEGERRAIDAFLGGTHGMNEMNVVRGLRKVMRGEESTFSHEVRLSVYGEWCGHEGTPTHYPRGYGKCADCDPKDERDDDD